VKTLLSTPGSESLINYQDEHALTPLIHAAHQGHAVVSKQLLAARCMVNLEAKHGRTALQIAEFFGHTGIATLIRSRKQEIARGAI
jgi:ankyrin repeat protein